MTTWPLVELKVSVLTRVVLKNVWGWLDLPLPQSPFTLSLLCRRHTGVGRKIFQDYRDILTDESNPSGVWNPNESTYEEFMDLYEDIKKNGVKDTSTISISNKSVIGDGQHRLAILFSLGEKTITLPDR